MMAQRKRVVNPEDRHR